MMDALDSSAYDETAQGEENYILAQNKLWVITGEVSDFSAQIASLTEQSAQVQAQLGGRPRSPPSDGLLHPQLCHRAAPTPGQTTSSR